MEAKNGYEEESPSIASQAKDRDRISAGLSDLWRRDGPQPPFDVVVVGSGYGGSAAAAAFAGKKTTDKSGISAPLKVCVLERGREYLPGEFPSRFSELPSHVRMGHQTAGKVRGNHEGLFDIRLGDDVMALVASGVGGGSLINAGVLLEPAAEDFDENESPLLRKLIDALRKDKYFDRAKRELGGFFEGRAGKAVDNVAPKRWRLGKATALMSLAGRDTEQKLIRNPISIETHERSRVVPNTAGVRLNTCNTCGDCMTGCNVGAKNSLDVNLLEKAARAKTEIFTGASVVALRRSEKRNTGEAYWVIDVVHTDPRMQERESGPLQVLARHVVLAAGALGSTEILLRSRTEKLVFSRCLGEKFSCNGDNIAAIYPMPEQQPPDGNASYPLSVGPTITASITVRDGSKKPFLVQEFSIPAAMRQLFEEVVTTASLLHRMPKDDDSTHGAESNAAIDPLAVNEKDIKRTLVVGIIGHDDAAGTLLLPHPLSPKDRPAETGTVRIRWPEARHSKALNQSHEQLAEMVKGIEGPDKPILVANPMWRMLPKDLEDLVSQPRGPVLTVHPLGGCPIGTSALDGVVNEFGCVFDAAPALSDRWEGTLVVLDGAVFPGSLGVNPALTISAFAMRALDRLCDDWIERPQAPQAEPVQTTDRRMLSPSNSAPAPAAAAAAPAPAPTIPVKTHVEIVERLSGTVALQIGDDTRDYVVELTMAFGEVVVRDLISKLRRELRVDPAGWQSRIRLYGKKDWDERHLRVESDLVRDRFVAFEADLSGRLSLLHREQSSPWRRKWHSLPAWFRNRGVRDTFQSLSDDSNSLLKRMSDSLGAIPGLCRLASRAGEVRLFEYDLKVGEVHLNRIVDRDGREVELARAGNSIKGCKRLTYNRRANPWRQLTEMELTDFPGKAPEVKPVLRLDLTFLANQGFPMVRVTKQQDHAQALLDLLSLALFFARLLISTHLWTFRKPDAPSRTEPVRLPGSIPGLKQPPEVTELVVDRMPRSPGADDPVAQAALNQVAESRPPVKIRLTRYRAATPRGHKPLNEEAPLPPLVMIHGYSVSGNTFAHESLRPSAAEFFCREGRDVWVVDLRTSTGLDTATVPWSMEQVALVDIPAALLHIRNVTQQRVDVFAHCIGCVMLSMALLAEAREIRSGRMELGVDSWLEPEHLGILTAFNGARRNTGETCQREHPCIRRIILSQKGPVLRYTEANAFRAFLAQSVRRWLLGDDYQFRPPQYPTVTEQLLDRLLASVPYEDDAEYDAENPFWGTRPWVATRHRMDALYGRDFNAANMRARTLAAIDDLFGPMNLDTVAQTIHFARFRTITNQSGRGEFVSHRRLRECWSGIPTLAIHGSDNGLVDVTTQQLLQTHLGAAGVPLVSITYHGMGHQDVLIGRKSKHVFKDIEKFLEDPMKEKRAAATGRWVAAVPWVGPRIDQLLQTRSDVAGAPLKTIRCSARPDRQDAQIGKTSKDVSKDIEKFLEDDATKERTAARGRGVAAIPWVGPRIDLPDANQNSKKIQIACLSRPDAGRARLCLVPGRRMRVDGVAGGWAYEVLENLADGSSVGKSGDSRNWLRATPKIDELAEQDGDASQVGFFAVLLYLSRDTLAVDESGNEPIGESVSPPGGETPSPQTNGGQRSLHATASTLIRASSTRLNDIDWGSQHGVLRVRPSATPSRGGTAGARGAAPLTMKARVKNNLAVSVADWIRSHPPEIISLTFVALNVLQSARRLHAAGEPQEKFTFALGSCQYPASLLDAPIAGASLRRLADALETPSACLPCACPPCARPDLVLFLGDQVYADATAGLVDPARRDEKYDQPHERALRLKPMRAVLRNAPVRMLLDDHELSDNWAPLPPDVARQRPLDARSVNKQKEYGVRAWRRHQLMREPDRTKAASSLPDLQFSFAGYPFYLGDTRTGRSARGSLVAGADQRIMSAAQQNDLQLWLCKHRNALKFVATPSLLLPRRRATRDDAFGSDRSDAWDGFPASLQNLLEFLASEQIGKTVFLSGDEHHSLVSEIWLEPANEKPTVKIVSVHSSALYAPFPFANGRLSDLICNESFVLGGINVTVKKTTPAPPGDGFALVSVTSKDGACGLQVSYSRSGGTSSADFFPLS